MEPLVVVRGRNRYGLYVRVTDLLQRVGNGACATMFAKFNFDHISTLRILMLLFILLIRVNIYLRV